MASSLETDVFQHDWTGVWEVRICWVLKGEIQRGLREHLPTAPIASIACGNLSLACLIDLRPSPQNCRVFGNDKPQEFRLGDERHLVSISTKANDAVTGASAERTARPHHPDHHPDQAQASSHRQRGDRLRRSPATWRFVSPCGPRLRLVSSFSRDHLVDF